jgi:quinolinate synthase
LEYRNIEMNINEQILKLKKELGDRIIIPAHHYENPEIVAMADFVGDSYKLAVDCSKVDTEFIVFCGVYFMAEAADILSSSQQKVIMPDIAARCPMADQIGSQEATHAWQKISGYTTKKIAPVVYMNSTAEIKGFSGKHGGSVCTSSNASKIVQYYLDHDQVVFFAPDFNLGINTAKSLGLKQDEIVKVTGDFHCVGNPHKAKMFIWDGYCYVHKRFLVSDILEMRFKYPSIRIIVHPECDRGVVQEADDSGSTQKIYDEIKKSATDSVWGVGTEYNFVKRIADEFPDKTILPLRKSICANMAKITSDKLLKTLKSIRSNSKKNKALAGIVQVEESMKTDAAKALRKMIDIVEK